MDFFSSAAQHHTEAPPEADSFAKAVNERFTPQLLPFSALPSLPSPRLPPLPPSNTLQSTPPLSVSPPDLTTFLNRSNILILDIRSHHAYSTARITGAISLSVPSTLLKRPLFSTQRLGAMMSSPTARAKFATWADHDNIIVYDADTVLIKPTCNISGLLQKFRNEGYSGNLAYVSGGFQSVWKERRDLVVTTTPNDEEDEDDVSQRPPFIGQQPDLGTPSNNKRSPALRTKRLPPSAFLAASTITSFRSPSCSLPSRSTETAHHHDPALASNPFFDSIRQNVELSQGVTERIPLRLPLRVRRRLSDLPFSWLRTIACNAGSSLNSPSQAEEMKVQSIEPARYPEDVSQAAHDEATEALALQFYKIELSEQRRLQAVMDHHSKESGTLDEAPVPSEFPYSITAGVEKGTKNRYRHIWPFEHARVRLRSPTLDHDDYVNASYVQPLGTQKRYIATQGPLDATFVDFWTLIWQQNVHVIVMLTREVEGSLIKCGRYWAEGTYGPLSLQLVAESGDLEHERERDISGARSAFFSDFAAQSIQTQRQLPKHNRTIKRQFLLRHSKFPKVGARKVIQLQYLGWPDMTVPDDPRGILQLVRDTDAAVKETDPDTMALAPIHDADSERLDPETGIWRMALANRPVLLHCSAGVGRTGGFIAVDAILDAIKREIKQGSSSDTPGIQEHDSRLEGDTMDVDNPLLGNPLGLPFDSDQGDSENVTPDTKTRQWVERVSEMTEKEVPFNPNKPMPISRPHSLASTSSHSIATSSRPSFESFQTAASSSPSSHPFPIMPTKDSKPHFELHKGKGRTFPPDSFNVQSHDRLRAFSTPSSGISGFALGHRPSLSGMLPGPPMTLSPSPSRATPSASSLRGPGPSPLVSSISGSTGEVPDNSSSDFSAVSSRSVSPLAHLVSTSAAATSPEPINSPFKGSQPSRIEASMSLPELPLTDPQVEQIITHDNTAGGLTSSGSLNYTLPRKLHAYTEEPANLSSFEDPIMTVLLDMRQQRMSLCQNLRQYIFVHAAVVEGALQILDEERKEEDANWLPRVPMDTTPVAGRPSSKYQAQQLSSSPSATSTMGTTSTGKRVASPTELPMEDKEGGLRLTKRPSVKRRSEKGEHHHFNAQLSDMPQSRTSQPAPALASLREGYPDP